jgi:hypothetical protein
VLKGTHPWGQLSDPVEVSSKQHYEHQQPKNHLKTINNSSCSNLQAFDIAEKMQMQARQ